MVDSVIAVHPLFAQAVGVIDLQNRVLLYDSKEQQKAEAREDVDGLMRDEQRHDPEGNRQRQRDQVMVMG